ncbi:hypothetical protein [Aegicerativicinus sediminis]|uniref:hypothetical protein n=1 Tax=Aegicerativicinus sediminis TaxID=2893202 RepID=UPI001E3045F5|nr:hypothetical protein [Aegicerativicinus sediminis]
MNRILNILKGIFSDPEIYDRLFELFKGDKAKQREFELKVQTLIAERFKQEIDDLQDARKMQIEALKQNDRFSKRFLYYMTAFLIFCTIGVSLFPFFMEFPTENTSEIQRATDFLYTVTGARVIAYFFGTKLNT